MVAEYADCLASAHALNRVPTALARCLHVLVLVIQEQDPSRRNSGCSFGSGEDGALDLDEYGAGAIRAQAEVWVLQMQRIVIVGREMLDV